MSLSFHHLDLFIAQIRLPPMRRKDFNPFAIRQEFHFKSEKSVFFFSNYNPVAAFMFGSIEGGISSAQNSIQRVTMQRINSDSQRYVVHPLNWTDGKNKLDCVDEGVPHATNEKEFQC
jgi:hypothetical protein